MAKKLNTYVIDTNVFLSDFNCLKSFGPHDIAIPMKVLEEIDKHKKRQDPVGMNARSSIRLLDELREENSLQNGVKLEKGGTVYVQSFEKGLLPADLDIHDADNQIICTALTLKKEGESVIMVSRDVNMRVKCDALGLDCEDYTPSQIVEDTSSIYTGLDNIIVPDAFINDFYAKKEMFLPEQPMKLYPNQFLMLISEISDTKTALARFNGYQYPLKKISDKREAWGLKPRNKEQAMLLDLLLDPEIKLVTVMGSAGCGKAQPLDAKILTPTGWTTMGQIKVGEEVISGEGVSTKVLGVYPQGVKDIYKITFSDGSSTECCEEHLWQTRTQKDRDSKKIGSVKSLKDIIPTLRYQSGKKTIKKNHSIPMTRPVEFTSQDELPIDPYIFGCLLGDGSFRHQLFLSSNDDYIVGEFEKFLPKLGMQLNKKPGNNYDYSLTNIAPSHPSREIIRRRVGDELDFKTYSRMGLISDEGFERSSVHRVCSGKYSQYQGYTWEYTGQVSEKMNPIKKSLQNMGLWGHYSEEKFIPESYKFSSFANRLALLQGLMDTDGTVSSSGHNVTFYSSSKALAEGVQFLIQSFGGKATLNNKQTYYTYKGVKKSGLPSYVVNMSLPPDITPFRLPRKLDRYKPRTKYLPTRYIDTVELIGKKEAQCIMVEDSQHLYLTDDFIVTHNTLLACAAGLHQILEDDAPYQKMVVSRPVQPVGKEIGFLPGDLSEKMAPWIAPIMDNLQVLFNNDQRTIEMYMENGTIEIEAITYIRGRSIANSLIIVDEAQNLSPHEVKTILTRAGEGSKVILTGDINQIDVVYHDATSNGLTYAVEKFKDYPIAGHIVLTKGERSALASLAASIL